MFSSQMRQQQKVRQSSEKGWTVIEGGKLLGENSRQATAYPPPAIIRHRLSYFWGHNEQKGPTVCQRRPFQTKRDNLCE